MTLSPSSTIPNDRKGTDMPTDTKENVTEQMSALAVEATQTFIDAAYLAQRQSAQLLQAWLNTLDAGQKEQREIASQLIKQTKEAQILLQQYVQESSRAGTGVFTKPTK
jgi:BMFP domain-containing protein YqiC